MSDVRPLSCVCGQMQWRIADQARGTHLICYCADCQTYANTLDHGAARVDSDGGTEIFQTLPKYFKFLAGQNHLSVLRLGPKGILRWYSGCCGTPIANTLQSPRLPFVGAILPPGIHGYGPITALLSTVDTSSHIKEKGVLGAQLSVFGRVLAGLMSSQNRKSPFWGPNNDPVTEPRVLTKRERNAARPS